MCMILAGASCTLNKEVEPHSFVSRPFRFDETIEEMLMGNGFLLFKDQLQRKLRQGR